MNIQETKWRVLLKEENISTCYGNAKSDDGRARLYHGGGLRSKWLWGDQNVIWQ